VETLIALVKCIPENINASVFVVLHIPPHTKSFLPEILERSGSYKAVHPKDGETIQEKCIYVAPPDHHLLIEEDKVVVRKGPKENRFRPSIDALFRSAAYVYGSRVIGIVLSGALDDGTSGLWTIKRLGGIAIVQEPNEAFYPDMPLNVMEYVKVDYVAPVCEIGKLIEALAQEYAPVTEPITDAERELLEMEITISTRDNAFEMGIMNKGELTPFTCPECHGALVRLKQGKILRFRCHTGHAFTANTLLAGITKSVEESLWQSMRVLEEGTMLLDSLAEHFTAANQNEAAEVFRAKSKENAHRARIIHDSVFKTEQLSGDIKNNLNKVK
jgi:two-component system chemotaxis response regulator CheB